METLFKQLREYSKLEDDWDGYGGIPVPKIVINKSRELITFMKNNNYPKPKIMTSGHSVGFYWENINGIKYLEIEVDSDDGYSYLAEESDVIWIGCEFLTLDDLHILIKGYLL